MAIERHQNIRHAARTKLADHTNGGVEIRDGVYIMGSSNICGSCGDGIPPYSDGVCPNCKSI